MTHTHRWGHLRGRPYKCLDCGAPYIGDEK